MKLKGQTLKELQKIIEKDYGILLSDEEAEEFGISFLKITKTALNAFARVDKKNLSIPARVNCTLEPKTSK